MAKIVLKNVKKVFPNTEEQPAQIRKNRFRKEEELPAAVYPLITEEGVVAVRDFSLEIADKEFVVLVGPSGCGKSTTLRMIAGLEEISEGEIWIGDRLVNRVPPKDRNVAMVFQNYALFPHMTVYQNIAFALRMQKMPKAEIDRRVQEAARILDISQYLRRKPRSLSGGQRQRVAIGRAIVCDPQVFLMDEPLSNLDAKLRTQMRTEIIRLRERIQTTFVYVTHDQTEAMTLGDRIVVMKDGVMQQAGTPREVYDHPSNLFVGGFIGLPSMNEIRPCRLVKREGRYWVELLGTHIPLPDEKQAAAEEKALDGRAVCVGIRPAHVLLQQEEGLPAVVTLTEMLGSEQYVHLRVGDAEIVAEAPVEEGRAGLRPGQTVRVGLPPVFLHIFDAETEENLF